MPNEKPSSRKRIEQKKRTEYTRSLVASQAMRNGWMAGTCRSKAAASEAGIRELVTEKREDG